MPEILGTLKPPRLASAPGSPALGQLYYDTGTNILMWWNGTAWIPARASAPAPATTLPGSPIDGQQAIFVDSTTTPTYVWLFQWSSTASKWFFIGGSQFGTVISASATLANQATYADLPGGSPTLTCPKTGVYNIDFFCGNFPMTNAGTYISVSIGGATPSDNDSMVQNQSAGGFGSGMRFINNRSITVSQTVKLQYKASAGSGWALGNVGIAITPVYVT